MSPLLAWSLGLAVLFAVLCSRIADRKGRSVGGWAVLGFIFGVFALIVVACLRDLDDVHDVRPLVMPRDAGWYQDPYSWGFERYWTGDRWSEDVRQRA